MKILFLVYFDIEGTKFLGIKKKVLNQVDALRKLGHVVELAYCGNDELVIWNCDQVSRYPIKRGVTHYRGSILQQLGNIVKENTYEIAYIRFPGSIDVSVISTFRMLKKNGIKVLLEMPTYPIGSELVGRLKWLADTKKYTSLAIYLIVYFVHKICSRQIYRYVDHIVTFMPYEQIWGVPTVIIDNGVIIPDSLPLKAPKFFEDRITLIGVANVAIWHGYDRLIEGLYKYLNTGSTLDYQVTFNIVGGSQMVENLKMHVERLGLSDYVIFSGFLDGNDLLEMYKKADIAVSSLGMHRINVDYGSTLKAKEYCAYGIPFILGYNERAIQDSFDYVHKVPANNEPISIHDVIEFYKKIKSTPNIREEMHKFALENFNWEKQMQIVLKSLNY